MKPIEKEASGMLDVDSPPSGGLIVPSDSERTLYETIVPEEHFLRRLLQAIDFESFRPLLTSAYCPDQGRPPWDPVILLKLEVLARHYRLSDRERNPGERVYIAHRPVLGLLPNKPLTP